MEKLPEIEELYFDPDLLEEEFFTEISVYETKGLDGKPQYNIFIEGASYPVEGILMRIYGCDCHLWEVNHGCCFSHFYGDFPGTEKDDKLKLPPGIRQHEYRPGLYVLESMAQ